MPPPPEGGTDAASPGERLPPAGHLRPRSCPRKARAPLVPWLLQIDRPRRPSNVATRTACRRAGRTCSPRVLQPRAEWPFTRSMYRVAPLVPQLPPEPVCSDSVWRPSRSCRSVFVRREGWRSFRGVPTSRVARRCRRALAAPRSVPSKPWVSSRPRLDEAATTKPRCPGPETLNRARRGPFRGVLTSRIAAPPRRRKTAASWMEVMEVPKNLTSRRRQGFGS